MSDTRVGAALYLFGVITVLEKDMLTAAKLTLELGVDDLERSLAFYFGVIGFRVLFSRPEGIGSSHLELEGVASLC